jgi:hypothetical protein
MAFRTVAGAQRTMVASSGTVTGSAPDQNAAGVTAGGMVRVSLPRRGGHEAVRPPGGGCSGGAELSVFCPGTWGETVLLGPRARSARC